MGGLKSVMSIKNVERGYFFECLRECSLALFDLPEGVLSTIAGSPLRENGFAFDKIENHVVNLLILAVADDDRADMFLEVGLLVKPWPFEGLLVFFYMILMIILYK